MVTRKEILETALELTTGDRNKSYGDPYDNHQRIANIWKEILGCDVTASQVALCMVGVKLARLVETPDHFDSFVDGAAYMAIAGEIFKEKNDGRTETETPDGNIVINYNLSHLSLQEANEVLRQRNAEAKAAASD